MLCNCIVVSVSEDDVGDIDFREDRLCKLFLGVIFEQ